MTELKQKIPELNVIPAEELLDTTYAPSGTLIDGLMGQSIYILAGAPKVGKSWLVLWLANQVSKGEPVWGGAENGTVRRPLHQPGGHLRHDRASGMR